MGKYTLFAGFFLSVGDVDYDYIKVGFTKVCPGMTLTEFENLPISRRRKYTEFADRLMTERPELLDPYTAMMVTLFGKK